jgi:hypothetical protein
MSAYVPTEGKQVLRERYGDCKDKAALVTAMLAAVGIRAEMVLLSARDQGTLPLLPSPRFTHAIARVYTAGGPVWVDATADQMEFGGLPSQLQQVPALVIDEATTGLVLTPALPVEQNRLADTHKATLAADAKLVGSATLQASGDWAWMLRSALRLVPEANREEVLRGMAGAMLENVRYQSGSVEHLADTDQPLVLQIQYQIDRYSSSAGNFVLARLPWSQGSDSDLQALPTETAREQDLEVSNTRGHYVSAVRLELPPGFLPQDLQPEVRGESPWGSYCIRYRLEGNVLHAERDVRITPLRVAAKDVPRYVEFMRSADEETRRQIVFLKP